MVENIIGLLKEIWFLLNAMSPYLLFGFLIAGILHVFIAKEKIYSHFSKNNFSSILKAALFGIPLPLCSCGVIPVAAHLRNEGAGKSATLTFLVSTPTTGFDSILATYSLLGPVFTIIRPIAAFFGGLLAGTINNVVDKEKEKQIKKIFSCSVCDIETPHGHTLFEKIRTIIQYGFFDLIRDTWKWLVIGILIGGVISFFVPTSIIEKFLSISLISYPLMILLSIPMYVCATGSIPIAASLILKGMSPGAGLVFLIAGPATNTATLSFVRGKLGKKAFYIYISSIVITAFLFGAIVDFIWHASGRNVRLIGYEMSMLPAWVNISSSILLLLLIVRTFFMKKQQKIGGEGLLFKVPDVSCEHCVKTIVSSVKKVKNVQDVHVNIKTKEVEVIGTAQKKDIISAIEKAGYTVEKEKK